MADSSRNTIQVESPNFVPIISGIGVDIGHGLDTVEVEIAWVRVTDDVPFQPGTAADVTDGGAGAGPDEVGNLARASGVEVIILRRRGN